jgi:hypothetical protein
MPLMTTTGEFYLFLTFPETLLLFFGVLVMTVRATDAFLEVLGCQVFRVQGQAARTA